MKYLFYINDTVGCKTKHYKINKTKVSYYVHIFVALEFRKVLAGQL